MKTIWKFPLAHTMEQEIEMPYGARILCAQRQGVDGCLWAEVDPENVPRKRVIRIYGTGHDHDEGAQSYIGTYQSGAFVWHVYERI